MTEERSVAGLFIRRDLVYATKSCEDFGPRTTTKHQISAAALAKAEHAIFPVDPDAPLEAIKEACAWIKEEANCPVTIGIASYGPFKSLRFASRDHDGHDYGYVIGHDTGGPIGDISLRGLVAEQFAEFSAPPLVIVQTDVAACGLGEFYYRVSNTADPIPSERLSIQDTLIFLNFTEGVGGAIITKGNVMGGRHHSEVGQISVTPHVDDISEANPLTYFDARLEELASMQVFRTRMSDAREDQYAKDVARTVQAFYIAQLCLAVSYIVAPSKIVVSLDLEENDLLKRTRIIFRKFLKRNSLREGWYEALTKGNSEFIQSPAFGSGPMGACGAGAAGTLCLAAYAYRKALKPGE